MNKLILLLLILFPINSFGETIRIGTEKYEPYVIVDDEGNHSGVIVELIREAFAKEGVEVLFENYPVVREIVKLDNNEIDAAMPKMKTKERMKKYLFSEPIIESTSKFFYIKGRRIKDDFKWKTLEDFKDYKIGGTLGYWYLEEFSKIGLSADVAATDIDNIRKLYVGRTDVFIIDEITGWQLINKIYPKSINEFSVIEKEESIRSLYLMFNKKNKKSEYIIRKFNDGLKKIRESGEYKNIIKKYI